jgi:hypothetical protein
MRRLIVVGMLCLAGCQGFTGPFAPRSPVRVDDPRYSIREQESLARDRYAFPEQSPKVAPPAGSYYPLGQ